MQADSLPTELSGKDTLRKSPVYRQKTLESYVQKVNHFLTAHEWVTTALYLRKSLYFRKSKSFHSADHLWILSTGTSPVAQTVVSVYKRETWARPLGQEDPLEKEMATHSCIIVWEIPWTEEPGRLQALGSQKSQT